MNIPGYDAWKLQGPPEPSCDMCGDTGWLDCMNCGGDGEVDDCGTECPACDGTGRVECKNHDEPDGDFLYEQARDRWEERRK